MATIQNLLTKVDMITSDINTLSDDDLNPGNVGAMDGKLKGVGTAWQSRKSAKWARDRNDRLDSRKIESMVALIAKVKEGGSSSIIQNIPTIQHQLVNNHSQEEVIVIVQKSLGTGPGAKRAPSKQAAIALLVDSLQRQAKIKILREGQGQAQGQCDSVDPKTGERCSRKKGHGGRHLSKGKDIGAGPVAYPGHDGRAKSYAYWEAVRAKAECALQRGVLELLDEAISLSDIRKNPSSGQIRSLMQNANELKGIEHEGDFYLWPTSGKAKIRGERRHPDGSPIHIEGMSALSRSGMIPGFDGNPFMVWVEIDGDEPNTRKIKVWTAESRATVELAKRMRLAMGNEVTVEIDHNDFLAAK